MTGYQLTLLISILLFSALASGLTLLMGKGGLFSVMQALFFGIGAYATGVLSVRYGWAWAATIPVGMVLAAALAVAVAGVSLRVHSDYFVIASFGLQVIGTSVSVNWRSLTGGVMGISGVPEPSLFGWVASEKSDMLVLMAVTFAVVAGLIALLARSPYGRTLTAIRDDEVAARALGKNVLFFKVSAFAITGALAGLVGSVYAGYLGFVGVTDFTIDTSILIVAMVIVGGLGTVRGAVAGAVLLVLMPEALRNLQVPPDKVGIVQQAVYGLVLVLFVVLRPQGLFPDRGASLRISRRG